MNIYFEDRVGEKYCIEISYILSVSNNVKFKKFNALSFYSITHRFFLFPDNLSKEKFAYFLEVFRQILIIPRLVKLKLL